MSHPDADPVADPSASPAEVDPADLGGHRDTLPDDLNAIDHLAPYRFPDNSRRRIPAVLHGVVALACAVWWWVAADDSPLVNRGMLWAAVLLGVLAVYSFSAGWRMRVDEREALVVAQGAVGFPVGHASAQQVWRGLRSRPTWRVLVYSADEPPRRRGLVLVDAVDGRVVEHLVQDNPAEEWDA